MYRAIAKFVPAVLTAFLLVCVSAANAPAQVRPDAGSLLREQQRNEPPTLNPLNPWEAPEKERAPLEETGEKFLVKGFRFTGIEGLATSAELDEVLKDAVGKEMGLGNLRRVADRVTRYLHKKGWFLARAYIPQQEIKEGIVEIAVLAGRLQGGAVIRGENLRISESTLQKMAEPAAQEGCSANQQDLARSLLLMNDLPGIRASSTMEPGESPGTAKLIVDASEGPLLDGRVWGDNYGSRYTDSWRGNGLLQVNDPLRYGDQLIFNTTDNLNYQYGQAAYNFPIGYSGLRGTVLYNEMRYSIDQAVLPLDLFGGSRVFDAGVNYPIIRSRTANLWTGADFSWKNLWDFASVVQLDNKTINVGSVRIYGDLFDTLLGGGYNTMNAGFTGGSLDLTAVTLYEAAGTNGEYGRFNYGLSRLQRLCEQTNLFMSVNGQVAFNNLDSSEQFILGGPNGVRAYPVGEAPGDSGGIFTAEVRYDLPEIARIGFPQLVAFYDLGWATLHESPWLNSGTAFGDRNSYSISGAGIGANLTKTRLYAIRVAWAAKIGTNPGRSAAGLDADGKSDSNRYWLQATVSF